jgi:tetratricopeptide (TPR) repeat protein
MNARSTPWKPARLFPLVVVLLILSTSLGDPFAEAAAWVRTGDQHFALGEYTFARDAQEQARALLPTRASVLLRLAQSTEALHRWDEALRHFGAATACPWARGRARAGLARIAAEVGDTYQTARLWEQAVSAGRNDPEVLGGYARFLWQRGEFEQAQSALDRWLQLRPEDADACYFMGIARLLGGDASGARASLRCAAQGGASGATPLLAALSHEDAPGSPDFCLRMGVALLSIGENGSARLLFGQARSLAPDSPVAGAYYAYTLSLAGDDAGALGILRDVARLWPSYGLVWYFLGEVEGKAGRFVEAREHYARLLALDPKNSAACAALGDTYAAEDRFAEAEAWYQKAVEFSPQDGRFWLAQARFYVERLHGAAIQGVASARKAAQLLPDDPAAHDVLGWALFLSNDLTGARGSLERSLQLDGRSASVQYHAGSLYYALGDRAKALYHLTRVLDLEPAGRYADLAGDLLRALGR